MLPEACRIRLKRDFERIFSYRRSVSGRFVRLTYAPPATLAQKVSRFAVVTSSKVSKRAVVRNRFRRRARSVIAEALPSLPRAVDVIIVCQPSAASSNFTDFRDDLRSTLGKIFNIRL